MCPTTYKENVEKQPAATPTAVSQKTKSHIDDAAPAKIQLSADELNAGIATYKADIARYKLDGLGMDVTTLEAAIKEKERQL